MRSITGKKVLVTGASGFVGSNLSARLKELGAEIYGVSTRKQEASPVVDKWYTGDLADLETTRSLIKKSSPHLIFHLAAFASGRLDLNLIPKTYHNNLTSTINILTAATEAEVERVILAGSMEEPEDGREGLIPSSPYAASKYAGTIYAKMFNQLYGTPVTIPRIFKVYGPGDENLNRLLPYVIQSLFEGKKPSLTNGSRIIDWIYIGDLVEALVTMAKAEGVDGQTIDVGSGKAFSVQEVVKKIESIIDNGIQIEFGELPDRKFEYDRIADISRAKQLLNWEPAVSIDMGLKKTVAWYKNYFAANA